MLHMLAREKCFCRKFAIPKREEKKRKASFLSVIDRERRVPEGYCVSGMTSGV